MTMTIKTENEQIIQITTGDIKKGDVLAFTNDPTKKAKVTHIEFKTWQGKEVAFFDFIELETLRQRKYAFIDVTMPVNKVLGYESLEQINLKCECKKLLGKATFKGVIEIKCPKCKIVNTFSN